MTAEIATAVIETPAPKTKTAAKKTPAKAKTVAKATSNGGLRKPQYRILKALAKGKPLTRAQIAEKAQVDKAFLSTYIGAHDEKVRAANEKKRGIKGLLTLGYVRFGNGEDVGAPVYEITSKGKSALEKLG